MFIEITDHRYENPYLSSLVNFEGPVSCVINVDNIICVKNYSEVEWKDLNHHTYELITTDNCYSINKEDYMYVLKILSNYRALQVRDTKRLLNE